MCSIFDDISFFSYNVMYNNIENTGKAHMIDHLLSLVGVRVCRSQFNELTIKTAFT